MKFLETNFENLWSIEPEIKRDSRGFLTRMFCKKEFSAVNFNREFVQENITFTQLKGTFRGLHYQLPPFGEVKLISCIKGKVFDIVVDLREGSKTFLKSFCIELTEEKMNMVFVPEGFAHGFQTLTDTCMMLYMHSNFYHSEYERGLRYDDPVLKLSLPLPVTDISERDGNHSNLTEGFKGLNYAV